MTERLDQKIYSRIKRFVESPPPAPVIFDVRSKTFSRENDPVELALAVAYGEQARNILANIPLTLPYPLCHFTWFQSGVKALAPLLYTTRFGRLPLQVIDSDRALHLVTNYYYFGSNSQGLKCEEIELPTYSLEPDEIEDGLRFGRSTQVDFPLPEHDVRFTKLEPEDYELVTSHLGLIEQRKFRPWPS